MAGTQIARNLEAESEQRPQKSVVYWLTLYGLLNIFLTEPRTTSLGVEPPIMG